MINVPIKAGTVVKVISEPLPTPEPSAGLLMVMVVAVTLPACTNVPGRMLVPLTNMPATMPPVPPLPPKVKVVVPAGQVAVVDAVRAGAGGVIV